jgi:hypothetical protein
VTEEKKKEEEEEEKEEAEEEAEEEEEEEEEKVKEGNEENFHDSHTLGVNVRGAFPPLSLPSLALCGRVRSIASVCSGCSGRAPSCSDGTAEG